MGSDSVNDAAFHCWWRRENFRTVRRRTHHMCGGRPWTRCSARNTVSPTGASSTPCAGRGLTDSGHPARAGAQQTSVDGSRLRHANCARVPQLLGRSRPRISTLTGRGAPGN